MIHLNYPPEIKDEVMRTVEQALKGVDVQIAEVDDVPDVIDIAAYMSYNIKQQRVYLGRVEKNTRELKNELVTLNELLKNAFELLQPLVLDELEKREDVE